MIQTTGTCNFGKLNYYLGSRAKKRGAAALYPEINFCKDPEVICRDDGPPELKWISGLFYWMESVQAWDDGDFNFMEKLENWVDAGMDTSDTSLVDAASGIVNRGCPKTVCAAGEVHALQERRDNFKKVMDAMMKVFDTPVKTQKPVSTTSTQKPDPTTTTTKKVTQKATPTTTTKKVTQKATTTTKLVTQKPETTTTKKDTQKPETTTKKPIILSTTTTSTADVTDNPIVCDGYWRKPNLDHCHQFREVGDACNLSTDLRCSADLVCDSASDTHRGVCRKKDGTTKGPSCGADCDGYCKGDKCEAYKNEGDECNYSTKILCATNLTCFMGKDPAPGSSGVCKELKVKTCENCDGYCHATRHECELFRKKGEKCNGSLDIRCDLHLFCDVPDSSSHKRRRLQSGTDGVCREEQDPSTTESADTSRAVDSTGIVSTSKSINIVPTGVASTSKSIKSTAKIIDLSSTMAVPTGKANPCPSGLFLSNSGLMTDEQCAMLCAKDADSCITSGQCRCLVGTQVSENGAYGFSLAVLLILPTLF